MSILDRCQRKILNNNGDEVFVLRRSLSSKKMTEVSVLGRCLPSRESKKVTEEKQAPIFEMFVSGGGGGWSSPPYRV